MEQKPEKSEETIDTKGATHKLKVSTDETFDALQWFYIFWPSLVSLVSISPQSDFSKVMKECFSISKTMKTD